MIDTTGKRRLSVSVTTMSLEPEMTWKLVAIQPSSRTTNPVPRESLVRTETIAGIECAAMSAGVFGLAFASDGFWGGAVAVAPGVAEGDRLPDPQAATPIAGKCQKREYETAHDQIQSSALSDPTTLALTS